MTRGELRTLLADAAALGQRLGRLPEQDATTTGQKIPELRAAKRQLKQLKRQRGLLAPEARATDGAQLSQQIKQTEQTIGSIEAQLCTLLAEPAIDPAPANPHQPPAVALVAGSLAARFSVSECEPDLAWDTYCQRHPNASPYHQSRWLATAQRALGHNNRCWRATDDHDGRTVGVLPVTVLKSRMFGHFAVSLPFVNYGGALGDSEAIETALMAAAAEVLLGEGAEHVEFRDTKRRPGFPCRDNKVAMLLDLPESSDELWSGFKPKLRAQIRKPQQEQTRFVVGGKDQINAFYDVFARNMRDLGTPVYTRRLFEHIAEGLREDAAFVVLYHNSRPVSAGVLLRYANTVEIPWASTLRQSNQYGMNMLFYWQVLSHAVETGARRFDFGRSTRDAGTYNFKRQWGAVALPLYWHYALPDGAQMPQLNPDNPRYRLAVRAWQQLPVPLTRLIGPAIVRNLP